MQTSVVVYHQTITHVREFKRYSGKGEASRAKKHKKQTSVKIELTKGNEQHTASNLST